MVKFVRDASTKKIISFTVKFNIITKHQHGFLPGRLTEQASNSFVNYIYKQLDEKNVSALFFGMSKVFDSIEISMILCKCEVVCFRGMFLSFISSYLAFKICQNR